MKEGKEGVVKEERAVVGHLEAEMRTKRKMKMWALVKAKQMRLSTTPVIKTLEIREEEVEDVDKEASVVLVSMAMKKVILPLNALNDKEAYI